MKKIILILFVIFSQLITGQENTLIKGKIIDSVYIKNNFKESYALYIPNNHTTLELSPIVFIFEPAARGKIGIYPFIKAAEKYGYILICSNNSKNGPFEQNFEITNRLFEKVFSDFAINPKRIYTAGFSGGARLASSIAVLTKQIQGVIACGAGLSSSPTHMPSDDSFSYAAIIGDEDMNLLEMYRTKEYLSKLKISNSLFVYEINHKWPSQDQILSTFDWLQLEAYKKGIIPKNNDVIKTSYLNYYNKARQLQNNNKLLYAQEEYKRIIENFNAYYSIDSISRILSDLNKNKSLISEKKQLKSIFEEEVNLANMFTKRFKNELTKKNTNLKWWEAQISKLKKEEKNASFSKNKMIHRLLYKVYAMAIESANYGNASAITDKTIYCYDICILIYPEYPFLYFKQIENFIRKNDPDNAVNYVEKLLNSGYKNKKAILQNKAFESLKINNRFIALTKD